MEDYEHPIYQEMKEIYRKAIKARDEAYRDYNFSWGKTREDFDEKLEVITKAQSQILFLIDKMMSTKDVDADYRGYHASHMKCHLEPLEKARKEVSKYLGRLKSLA